jgi:lantibiotic modifying enzyme
MSREHEIFLEAAHFLGVRLCRDAIWAGKRCNWVGAGVLEQEGRPPTPARRACGADLYAGTSGIATFLGRLYVSTGEKIFLLTAEGAIRQALSRLDDFERSSRAGFYTGLTGVAYALVELAEISGREKFAAMALLILEEIGKDDTEGQERDFLTGSAGAIPTLLRIHQKRREDFLLASAIRHGERLLSALLESFEVETRRNAPVLPWESAGGLARGAAGVALALLELYCVTAEQRFLHASEQAFLSACDEATAAHLDPSEPPAPGLVPARGVVPPADSAAWFDGASGTGLARLRAYQLTGERRHLLKAEAALRTTTAVLPEAHTPPAASSEEAGEDFSPAHGLTGAAELPLCAGRFLGYESQRSFAERLGLRGIELYRKDDLPWPCGAPGGDETPGLMPGLAGIGYFYLRLHDATQNPSLLLVSPDGALTELSRR